MKNKTGIWVDTKKAVVVKLHENNKSLKTIISEIDTRDRLVNDAGILPRIANNFPSFDKQKEHKHSNQEKHFFKVILDELTDSGDVVLFGPAEVKHRLEKEIKSGKNKKFNLRAVEDADSMTDKQISAWVTNYFK